MRSQLALGPLLVALGVIGIGAVVLAATAAIPTTPIYAQVGPRIFPSATGVGLLVLGIILALRAVAGGWACEATDPAEPKPDLAALAWIIGGLFLLMVLIQPRGFVLASTAFFALSVRAFGVTRWWVSLPVGFAVAVLAYVGFARLLGLRMGEGLIESLI